MQTFVQEYRDFFLVARWNGDCWCGYIGRKDGEPLPGEIRNTYTGTDKMAWFDAECTTQNYFLHGLYITWCARGHDLQKFHPGIKTDAILPGFDCFHEGDVNISPDGRKIAPILGSPRRTNTMKNVFDELERAADLASEALSNPH